MFKQHMLGIVAGLSIVGLGVSMLIYLSFQRMPVGVNDLDNYDLVFSEEFIGLQLDQSKWETCYWWEENGCTNLGNQERQWYLPDNVTQQQGSLLLEARAEAVEGIDDQTFPYSSGMVTTGWTGQLAETGPRFAFQYGFVEVRGKAPVGQGLWPAVWMLPLKHESRPEIDMIEMLGHETDIARFNLYTIDAEGEQISMSHSQEKIELGDEWRVYGLLWTPTELIWYIDGEEMFRIDDETVIPAEPMYLILNLAVGGDDPGNPSPETEFPAVFEIDYVYIWQDQTNPDNQIISTIN